jgi:hypothetical protein
MKHKRATEFSLLQEHNIFYSMETNCEKMSLSLQERVFLLTLFLSCKKKYYGPEKGRYPVQHIYQAKPPSLASLGSQRLPYTPKYITQ